MFNVVSQGLGTGAKLAAVTGATMMAASYLERGSPWSGFNAMASVFGVGGRHPDARFDRVASPLGVATLTGGLLVWGVFYRATIARAVASHPWVAGALSGLGGYAVDRFVLPRRLVPNFERAMGRAGAIAKYAMLGLASARAVH